MTICVFCEHNDSTALALTAHARRIAPDARIVALMEMGGVSPELLGGCGADEVVLLAVSDDDCAQGDLIAQALRSMSPDAALFSATIRGRFLSAWVAAKLQTGLTADCTGLEMTGDGLLKQIRPAFGGNLTAEIICRERRPQMASVRPGVFPTPVVEQARAIPVRRFDPVVSVPERLKRISVRQNEQGVSLQNAKIIVAGGKGIGGKAGFDKLAELAGLMGGTVGASRSAVDAGWIGYEHQVGQTGVTVRPELYIAVGISGQIQHTAGMNGSTAVLAINSDRNAPIFQWADYGIVSEWEEAIDGIIQHIKERKEHHEL